MLIGKALSFIMNFVRAEDGHQMYFGDSVVGRLELGDKNYCFSFVRAPLPKIARRKRAKS